MTRLFVALWPSEAAAADVRVEVERVRLHHPGLRWQPPERWHITLAFLGQADLERAIHGMDRAFAQRPAGGTLRIAGAGAFGPVVWIGVEHGPWLADLARVVHRALHPPDRRFRAHLTVARGRGPDARRDAAAAVPDLAGHRGPPWVAQEVTLVESVTGPTPRYSVRHVWPLGPV